MKILAIGDFHGKFPAKLRKEARKADFIISAGDFVNADIIRKLIFKHWTNKSWIDVVGIKKAKEIERQCFNSGLKVLKELNSIGKKAFIIFGNTDFYKRDRYLDSEEISPGYFDDKIKKSKNLILVDRNKRRLGDLAIIGHGGYVEITDFIRHPLEKERRKQKIRLERYKEYEKRLFRLFSNKKPKNFILRPQKSILLINC